jgi:protein-disulfide isomerase
VRVVWKNRPLDFHKDAMPAALAAMAANEQGRFWDYHDKVFASQPGIGRDRLLQIAGEIGLDRKRFEAALNTAKYKPQIDADIAEANGLGASGTPAFFINGRFLSGAKPLAEFVSVINAELTRLNVPIAGGRRRMRRAVPPAGAVQVRPVPPAATAPVR